MVLYDILITQMCYRNLHLNHYDLKSDLNPRFRMKLLVYDLKMSLPNYPTFRFEFIMMHAHRVVVYYAYSCCLLCKFNTVFHAISFAPLRAICTWHLNRVSRCSKRIDKEEIGYHKPFLLT